MTWWGSWRRTQRCFWAALESAKFLILAKFSSVLLRPSKVYWLACITFFVSGPESVSAFDLSLLILIYCSGDVLGWQEPEDMEREAGFQFQRSRKHDFSFWICCRCSQNTGDLCRKMSHTSRLDKLQALRPGWTWVHQIDSNETYHTYHYTSDASYAYHFTSAIGCLHHCQSGWEVMAHASEISDPFDEVETRVELSQFFLRLGRHPRSWKETHAFWGRFFSVGGVKSDGKTTKNPKNGDFPENDVYELRRLFGLQVWSPRNPTGLRRAGRSKNPMDLHRAGRSDAQLRALVVDSFIGKQNRMK